MLGRLLGGVLVLAQRNARLCAVRLELVHERVVVLGNVLLAAQGAEVRHLQAAFGLELDDLAPVLVLFAFVLAFPDDRAARPPVRFDLGAEHVLLDLLGIGECSPDLAGRRIDLGLGGGHVVGHDVLLRRLPCAPTRPGSAHNLVPRLKRTGAPARRLEPRPARLSAELSCQGRGAGTK